MENRKISLIILGNNKIKECLENIKQQSYVKDIETIVLYKENKKEEIDKLMAENKEVVFLQSHDNYFKTLYQNIDRINGDFISILNSEDQLTIDYYRTMVYKAMKENADIVMSNSILKYLDGGQAYLNLSEATLREKEGKEILEEYIKQSGMSFLWNIYGNKIFNKTLFQKTLEIVKNEEIEIQNFYFFTVMFYYSKKLRSIQNEILFYNFEEQNNEGTRSLIKDGKVQNENINKNILLMEEFVEKNQIGLDINNWKKLYLNNDIELKRDAILKIKTAWNDNLEKLKRNITNPEIEVVSFDIFDTLIVRPVWNHVDVFIFMDEYFRMITNIQTGINFSKIRIDAESNLRKRVCNDAKQDVTLDEIYKEIQNKIHLENTIIEKLKRKEQELEKRFCIARKTAKEIYELALYLNKKVICISDMYLPIDVIQEILRKNNYEIENIYLSSEIKLTKHTGDLYEYVKKQLKVEPNKILHIGDNYYSDYENSKKHGYNAEFLPKAIDVFGNENITNALGVLFSKNIPMWQNTVNGLNFLGIRCMLAASANYYFDNPYRTFNNETDFNADPNLIGYHALGMHLFGIANWLIKETKNENLDKIIFCARDGYWAMRAYQVLKKAYKEVPEEKYLYVSRRALIPITLNNRLDFYKLSELIDIYKYTPKTILKYIKNILSNLPELENECKKNGIEYNKKFEDKEEFYNYIDLILKKFYDEKKHETILNKLKQYFSDIFNGNSAVFDIGYSAKPEMYLSKLCEKTINTYFINISNDEAYEHSKIGDFELKTYFDYRPAITGVVRESLMSTSDPSCIGYDIAENGDVTPIFEENKADYLQRFVFDAMQNKAIEFIEKIVDTFKEDVNKLYYQKYYISLPHEMYINSAKKLDQEILDSVMFEDAVGLGENITAIQEWDKEIKEKNQKRTKELFDVDYTKRFNQKIKELTLETNKLKQKVKETNDEKDEIMKKYLQRSEELNQIYNSKRWKCFEMIDKIIKRKK